MNKLLFTCLMLVINHVVFAQKTIQMSTYYANQDYFLNTMMRFEDIASERISFKSEELIGKYYQLNIKEFKKGKLVNTESLFDGSEADFFRLEADTLSLMLMTKMDDRLKLQLHTKHFSSKKLNYELSKGNGSFALKDFMGGASKDDIVVGKPFYVMAIITATPHKNGSASYCEVAQSGIDPEKLDQKFNIPHYFLVEMVFKK